MLQTAMQRPLEQQGNHVLQPFATSFEHIGQVLAALGTHCFIPNLPPPTQQLKQALRAATQGEQLIGDLDS